MSATSPTLTNQSINPSKTYLRYITELIISLTSSV